MRETRNALLRLPEGAGGGDVIEAVLATETIVSRAYGGEILRCTPEAVDLSAVEAGIAPVLIGHRAGGLADQIGTLEKTWFEDGKLIGSIRFGSRHPEIVRDIRAKVIRAVSVGYEILAHTDAPDPAHGILRTATHWKLVEVSFVPIGADPAAHTRSAAATEAEIAAVAGAFGLGADFATHCRAGGLDLAQTRAAALARASAPLPLGTSMTITHDPTAPETLVTRAAGALAHRINPALPLPEASREFASAESFADFARPLLHARGISTFGWQRSKIVQRALATGDLPVLMTDTLNATLRPAYTAAASALWQLAQERPAVDLRPNKHLTLEATGTFTKVTEGAEIKSRSTITEGQEVTQLETFANIYAITREVFLNDRFDAVGQIAAQMAAEASRFRNEQLRDLLTGPLGNGPVMADGVTVFDPSRNNISVRTGPGAFTVAALSEARLALRHRTSPAGKLLSLAPQYLIVPAELETEAEIFLTEITAGKTEDVNPFAGKLTLIVEPLLPSPDRWYLAAGPRQIEGMIYHYLNGAPGPQIEMEKDFVTFNTNFRLFFDLGLGFLNWRGWQMSQPTP